MTIRVNRKRITVSSLANMLAYAGNWDPTTWDVQNAYAKRAEVLERKKPTYASITANPRGLPCGKRLDTLAAKVFAELDRIKAQLKKDGYTPRTKPPIIIDKKPKLAPVPPAPEGVCARCGVVARTPVCHRCGGPVPMTSVPGVGAIVGALRSMVDRMDRDQRPRLDGDVLLLESVREVLTHAEG